MSETDDILSLLATADVSGHFRELELELRLAGTSDPLRAEIGQLLCRHLGPAIRRAAQQVQAAGDLTDHLAALGRLRRSQKWRAKPIANLVREVVARRESGIDRWRWAGAGYLAQVARYFEHRVACHEALLQSSDLESKTSRLAEHWWFGSARRSCLDQMPTYADRPHRLQSVSRVLARLEIHYEGHEASVGRRIVLRNGAKEVAEALGLGEGALPVGLVDQALHYRRRINRKLLKERSVEAARVAEEVRRALRE